MSSSQLKAQILASDLLAAGTVTVTVTVVNPAPSGTSNPVNFTVFDGKITFQSSRALDGSDAANTNSANNVWIVNQDGTGLLPLTNIQSFSDLQLNPVWSPDGTKVVFESARALDGSDAANIHNTRNIWVVNADGTGATPLTNLTAAGADSLAPVWSPDGTKVVFFSTRALDGSDAANTNSTDNIWVVNADGTGATPLTNLTAAAADSFSPVWSPDGTKVVFESARALDGADAANINLTMNIWVANADGSGATPLTTLTAFGAHSMQPVWSPDGTKVVFESDRALDGADAANINLTINIWAANANGSGATPLTTLTALSVDSMQPVWSPDGTKVAFGSPRALDGSDAPNANGTSNIWVVNADGSSPVPVFLTPLTASGANSFNPAWSPDGVLIFFNSGRALDGSDAANANATSNIWVVNANGSGGGGALTHETASGTGSTGPKLP